MHTPLSIGIVDNLHSRYGVDLYQFPSCFAGMKKMELLRFLWAAQEASESFLDWFEAHKGIGFERVSQAFAESLDEFLPDAEEQPAKVPDHPVNIREECWKLSGVLGIDCKSLTLRELLWMVRGKFPEVKPASKVDDHCSLGDLASAMGWQKI